MTDRPVWGSPLASTPPLPWNVGEKSMGGTRPLVMGVLNVTPDSFFDGGRHNSRDKALEHCESMIQSGADIIDVGGESTRPGSEGVSAQEELRRVTGIIKAIAGRWDIPISIDTTKSEVAEAALAEGAVIINDISGMADPEMARVAASGGASVVLNHIKGTPRNMQTDPVYEDVVNEVRLFLEERIGYLGQLGIPKKRVAVDPGIGFGKQLRHNYRLIAGLEKLGTLGCPILIGMSRKSFIGKTAGLEESDRKQPSIAAALLAGLKGASILRVHDVRETWEQLRIVEAILGKEV